MYEPNSNVKQVHEPIRHVIIIIPFRLNSFISLNFADVKEKTILLTQLLDFKWLISMLLADQT